MSILIDAIYRKPTKEIEKLLKGGVSPNVHDEFEVTPIMQAIDLERNDVVLILLKHGADLDVEIEGISAWEIAEMKANYKEFKECLKQ